MSCVSMEHVMTLLPLLISALGLLVSTVHPFSIAKKQPHIIFILADDMGWNDVSFHGSDQIPTPNIDAIGYHGVILNRHYVQPVCTPSRASLMTGKYPLHTGLHSALLPTHKVGLNVSEKILPQYLKKLGYSTHIIGKWHLGFYKKQMTPLERGFDSHFGYWSGAISYYDHIDEDLVNLPPYKYRFSGHDLRRNNSSAWDVVGQYATDLLTEEAVKLIKSHPHTKPLFLFLPHLAVHAGNDGKLLEAPQHEINKFSHISNPNRRTYAAMVSKLDKSVGAVMKALDDKDMLKNSIVVFLSDNGAPNIGYYNNWGSNYPWKGQKQTLWEGGVRTPAAIWSPLIMKPSRVSHNLMHITDWVPTLLAAAGYDSENQLEMDGYNQWMAISEAYPSPREHLVVDIDEDNNMTAVIVDTFKYLLGPHTSESSDEVNTFLNFDSIISNREHRYDIEELSKSPAWKALQKYSKNSNLKYEVERLRREAKVTCNQDFDNILNCDSEPCLFNVETDPCELNNIADSNPDMVNLIEDLISIYKKSSVKMSLYRDPASNPEFFNGTWSQWVE